MYDGELCKMDRVSHLRSWYEECPGFNPDSIMDFIYTRRMLGDKIYPAQENVLRAFDLVPFDGVRVVILGQDPYHNGKADGLAFSISNGNRLAPSLRNILNEVRLDVYGDHGVELSGDLCRWAKQGVLLINTVLTVLDGRPNSHVGIGWEWFISNVLYCLYERYNNNLVFMAWGKNAQERIGIIRDSMPYKKHLILTAAHPSPLSARKGFFGCKHFSKANNFLEDRCDKTIIW